MTKHRPQSKTSSFYHLSMSFPTLFQSKPDYLNTKVWKRRSNQFIQQTKKTKQTKTKNKIQRRSKTNTCAWNNKNEVFGRNLGFLLMKKGMPWASPSFDACTSWIFLGVTRGGDVLDFRRRARWEPQEEGMMSTTVSFPSVMKPRFNRTSRRKETPQRCY